MDIFSGFLTLIIVAGFVLFMVMKKGWKWQQVLAGMLLLGVMYGNFPKLPGAINQGVTNIVHVFYDDTKN